MLCVDTDKAVSSCDIVVWDLHTKVCLNAIFEISLDVFTVSVHQVDFVVVPES